MATRLIQERVWTSLETTKPALTGIRNLVHLVSSLAAIQEPHKFRNTSSYFLPANIVYIKQITRGLIAVLRTQDNYLVFYRKNTSNKEGYEKNYKGLRETFLYCQTHTKCLCYNFRVVV
jgi:hypothetical protein